METDFKIDVRNCVGKKVLCSFDINNDKTSEYYSGYKEIEIIRITPTEYICFKVDNSVLWDKIREKYKNMFSVYKVVEILN